jgi:hypothetical protein
MPIPPPQLQFRTESSNESTVIPAKSNDTGATRVLDASRSREPPARLSVAVIEMPPLEIAFESSKSRCPPASVMIRLYEVGLEGVLKMFPDITRAVVDVNGLAKKCTAEFPALVVAMMLLVRLYTDAFRISVLTM